MGDISAVSEELPYPVSSDLTKVPKLLKEYGVVVIPNVFTNEECNSWMREILLNMEAISGNNVNHKDPETWTEDKLPPQRRYGLYNEHILNNLKPVWEIRRDPRMKEIFEPVYSKLKGKKVDEFVCSIDGINIQPNISREEEGNDWPHCDQTERDDIFKCVQGQVVLTNSSASFRATPKSHKHFKEVMKAADIPDSSMNFAPLSYHVDKITSSVISPNKMSFQVPIQAEKGSVILWFSTTIHSAKSISRKEVPTPDDPFKGWRGVVYVCYRPRSEFNTQQLIALQNCIEENVGTSHWAKPIMPVGTNKVHPLPDMQKVIKNPKLVYDITNFSPEQDCFLINAKMEEDNGKIEEDTKRRCAIQ